MVVGDRDAGRGAAQTSKEEVPKSASGGPGWRSLCDLAMCPPYSGQEASSCPTRYGAATAGGAPFGRLRTGSDPALSAGGGRSAGRQNGNGGRGNARPTGGGFAACAGWEPAPPWGAGRGRSEGGRTGGRGETRFPAASATGRPPLRPAPPEATQDSGRNDTMWGGRGGRRDGDGRERVRVCSQDPSASVGMTW